MSQETLFVFRMTIPNNEQGISLIYVKMKTCHLKYEWIND